MPILKKAAKAAPKKQSKKIPSKVPLKKAPAVKTKIVSDKKVDTKKNNGKAQRKVIQEKLVTALSTFKPIIGEKKFHSLIKKASKLFSSEISKVNKGKEKPSGK